MSSKINTLVLLLCFLLSPSILFSMEKEESDSSPEVQVVEVRSQVCTEIRGIIPTASSIGAENGWRVSDSSDSFYCCSNPESRTLLYSRVYTTGQNYSFSESNQLIMNLKKPVQSSSGQLYFKKLAIAKFANEVVALLNTLNLNHRLILVPVPPSKARDHVDYDDRLEQVAQRVSAKVENVSFLPLLSSTVSRQAAHLSSGSRSVDAIYQSIQVDEAVSVGEAMSIDESQGGETIPASAFTFMVLDDVSTSGASMEAAFRRLQESFPNVDVFMVVWAKAKALELDLDLQEAA